MAQVHRRALAFSDLAEIWSFIADDSVADANRFLATLDAKLARLATQPLMGRQRDELMPALRSFPFRRYVVFFLPLRDGIDIVRVLHTARDISVADFGPDSGGE